jgi:hypothetical protein
MPKSKNGFPEILEKGQLLTMICKLVLEEILTTFTPDPLSPVLLLSLIQLY